MVKLFALEDKDEKSISKSNMLILDKLIENTKKEESPLSITADILEQKKELEKNIEKNINKSSEEETEKEENTSVEEKTKEDTSVKEETEKEEDTSSEKENIEPEKDKEEESKKEEDKEKKNKEKDKSESKEEEETKKDKEETEEIEESDLSQVADNKDSLKSLIGSEDKEIPKKEEKKEEVTKESFKIKTKKVSLEKIFTPILHSYAKYTLSLEEFGLKSKLSLEEQPVVYIKEDVIESLNNFIINLDFYKNKNIETISSFTTTVKNLNEKITILGTLIKERKFHFTNLVINEADILSNISVSNNSDIINSSNLLIKYNEISNNIVTAILKNDFSKLYSIFTANEFEKEENDLIYSKMLPGFNIVRVHLDPYTNFSKVKLNDYNYYIIKVLKTEDLYNLDSISINKDNVIDNLIDKMNILLIKLTSNIDTLNVLNTNLDKLLEETKALIYDIEQNKYDKLGELNIDNKIKDFIKFKIMFEICNVNINLLSNFLLQCLTVLDRVIELKS